MGSALVTPITALLMSLSFLFCLPAAIIVLIVSRGEKEKDRRKKLTRWSLLLLTTPFIVSVIGGIASLVISVFA